MKVAAQTQSAGDTGCSANHDEHDSLTHDKSEYISLVCAEGHANTDFPRAASDDVGHYAIKTHAGKQRGEQAKLRRQKSQQSFVKQGAVQLLRERLEMGRGYARSSLSGGIPQRGDDRGGRQRSADVKEGGDDVLPAREIDGGAGRPARVVLADVRYDADNFDVRDFATKTYMEADGVATGKLFLRRRFADYRHLGTGKDIGFAEIAVRW